VALDWSTIKREDVIGACELLLRGEQRPRVQAKGIFLVFQNERLPAKHALRLAYCLANKIPLSSTLKFSSGEGIIKVLRSLGFSVERSRDREPATQDTRRS